MTAVAPMSTEAHVVHVEPHGADGKDAAMQLSARSSSNPIQITYRNLSWTVKVKDKSKAMVDKVILKTQSGVFQPGRLTAVMGASGAGKTTLLNLIAGSAKNGTMGGEIFVNGERCSFDAMRRISAFVHQDDVILDTMTVTEALRMSALLRLPKDMPRQAKLDRVQEVIELLHLTKCKDNVIGSAMIKGISGGERRRVSLGMEMITNPSVLFLDEPTSGLDTFTAFTVIRILKQLADMGRTIVATIHQPSSDIFHQFDDFLLLAEGRVMYHGPAENVVNYFDQRGYPCPRYSNPADHLFMKVLNSGLEAPDHTTTTAENGDKRMSVYESEKLRVNTLLDAWPQSSEFKTLEAQVAAPRPPNKGGLAAAGAAHEVAPFGTQFELLAKRAFWNSWRNKLMIRGRTAQASILGLLIGLIYYQIGNDQKSVQDRTGSLFFIAVQGVFQATMSVITIFGVEKAVFSREYSSGMYGLNAYFASRNAVELPFRVFFPVLTSSIIYWLVGYQRDADKFLIFTGAMIVLEFCGTALGIFVACIFPDIAVAMAVLPVFLMPLMIFSGFFVNLSNLFALFSWISYLSPMRYGFQTLAKNEFYGLSLGCTPAQMVTVSGGGQVCPITSGSQVISTLGFDDQPSIGINILILLGLMVGLLTMAFFALRRTAKK